MNSGKSCGSEHDKGRQAGWPAACQRGNFLSLATLPVIVASLPHNLQYNYGDLTIKLCADLAVKMTPSLPAVVPAGALFQLLTLSCQCHQSSRHTLSLCQKSIEEATF